jgi:hypothetical protein
MAQRTTGRAHLTLEQRMETTAPALPTAGEFFFVEGQQFQAGVQADGFVSPFANPLQSLIGAATEFMTSISMLQPPPLYIPTPLGLLTGLRQALGEFDDEAMTEV